MDLLINGRLLEVFKKIDSYDNITEKIKKNVFKHILTSQRIMSFLTPKSSEISLSEKLKLLTSSLEKVD